MASPFDEQLNKIVDKATAGVPKWAGTAGMVIGGITLGASILDYGLHKQDKARMHAQLNEQERNRKKRQEEYDFFDKDVYYNLQELNGLPQQLYNNRNGHSNSWGGKKY